MRVDQPALRQVFIRQRVEEPGIDLAAARREAQALLTLLATQKEHLTAARKTSCPELKTISHFVSTLHRLIRLEHFILTIDIDSLTQYQHPNTTPFDHQHKIRALQSTLGTKKVMCFRINEGMRIVQESLVGPYAHHPAYAAILARLETIIAQTQAQQPAIWRLLHEVQEHCEAYHSKDRTPIDTYQLPMDFALNAIRQTTINTVISLRRVHELTRFILPINEAIMAQLLAAGANDHN